MRLLLGFLILSMLLAGCSAVDDIDKAARMIAKLPIDDVHGAATILAKNQSKVVSIIANSSDESGSLVIKNSALITRANNQLDDALRAAVKTSTTKTSTIKIYYTALDTIRQQKVRKIVDIVEDANRVKIPPELEDALDAMLKDTACLYLEKVHERRLPTEEELYVTLFKSGAGELFKYDSFEAEFFFSVAEEMHNQKRLEADTRYDQDLVSLFISSIYCGE